MGFFSGLLNGLGLGHGGGGGHGGGHHGGGHHGGHHGGGGIVTGGGWGWGPYNYGYPYSDFVPEYSPIVVSNGGATATAAIIAAIQNSTMTDAEKAKAIAIILKAK